MRFLDDELLSPLVPSAPAEAPGALAAIGQTYPAGPTYDGRLYALLQTLESRVEDIELGEYLSGGLGAGDVVYENIGNVFTQEQSIVVNNIINGLLQLTTNNTAPGSEYPLVLVHKYSPGVGPAGLGTGIQFRAESGTEGVVNTLGAVEAQSVTNTNGAMTGRINITLSDAGTVRSEIEFHPRKWLSVRDPIASAQHGMLNVGAGGFSGTAGEFSGSAAGTHLAVNAASAFTGDLIHLQKAGVSRLRLTHDGVLTINGAAVGGGGPLPANVAYTDTNNAFSVAQTISMQSAGVGIDDALGLVRRYSTGAGSSGIGCGLLLSVESTSEGTAVGAGRIAAVATSLGASVTASELQLYTYLAGAAVEQLRVANTSSRLYARDAAQLGPTTVLQLRHELTSGSPGSGFGSALEFWGLDSLNAPETMASIRTETQSVGVGQVDADLLFLVTTLTSTPTVLRLKASDSSARVAGKLLAVGGWGTGNAVSQTTLASPGTVIRRIEVYDQFGSSLGSVAVYANGSFS